jgi:uroporphyrinogen-III synthase
MPNGLAGVRVVCLESRRSPEMARLVEKQGGIALSAPSMQEVALTAQAEALAFVEPLSQHSCDVLLLLTGVGARLLFDLLETRLTRSQVVELLRYPKIYCRGPKPMAVLKELGLTPHGVAAEPNTWRELLSLLERAELRGKHVYIQEYGRATPELTQALQARGALVHAIPVYAWSLPDDVAPLERAARALADASVDAVAFTSGQQLEHLLTVATRLGCHDALLAALKSSVVVASIGPVTSEALAQFGVVADVVPAHPKMGQLISTLANRWSSLGKAQRRRIAAP